MKGSPFYRNFGIGSPNKQATISSVSDSLQNKPNPAIEKLIKELEETQDSTNTANQAELERRAKQIQQNVSPKEFNKQIEEHNKKVSPNKQFEEGDYYDTRSKSPNKQKATLTSVSDSLQNLPNPSAEKLRKEYEKALKKLQEDAQKKLDANTDSTNTANQKELNKRADQIQQNVSPKEFNKQVKDFNKKNSPNKQTYYGGTESEKGNIFTKKGREQRKVNKFKKTQKKLLDNVNKEGYDTKKSKRLMKKTNKRLSKTSQIHQDVQSGKKVIYKGGDPKDKSNYISNQN